MNKNIQKLISDIAQKCLTNGINFRLEYTDSVDQENLPCSGYFDEKTLAVAVKKPRIIDWLDVLVHESCHLDQYLEKSKYWVSDKKSLFVVEAWIHGKKVNKKDLQTGFTNTVALELDCEKRTVKKLKKYNIPFNEKQYIRKANAYLFSYGYTLANKKWYPKPYENTSITKKMPVTFLKVDNYLDFTNKHLQYYKRER
jgi:hypothetical protein